MATSRRHLNMPHRFFNLRQGQILPDNASAGHEHAGRVYAQLNCGDVGHGGGIPEALLAGAGVGTAAVDNDSAYAIAWQAFLAQHNSSPLKLIAGENRSRLTGSLA